MYKVAHTKRVDGYGESYSLLNEFGQKIKVVNKLGIEEFDYDTIGNMVSHISSNFDGTINYAYELKYDEKNRLIYRKHTLYNGDINEEIMEYSNIGSLISQKQICNGELKYWIETDLNEEGLPIRRRACNAPDTVTDYSDDIDAFNKFMDKMQEEDRERMGNLQC